MGTGTKLIAHEGMGSGMGIFSKRGYGDGHYGTLPNGYPLPSLITLVRLSSNKSKGVQNRTNPIEKWQIEPIQTETAKNRS